MALIRDDGLGDTPRPSTDLDQARYELRYRALSPHACSYAFPSDASGHVHLDLLSERARENYLCARAMVGYDLLRPRVPTVH
jgi:hypothetical protein